MATPATDPEKNNKKIKPVIHKFSLYNGSHSDCIPRNKALPVVRNRISYWGKDFHLHDIDGLVVKREILGCILKSEKKSYCKISQSLEGARSCGEMLISLWNFASGSTVMVPRHLQNLSIIAKLQILIWLLRYFANFYKVSYAILKEPPCDLCTRFIFIGWTELSALASNPQEYVDHWTWKS